MATRSRRSTGGESNTLNHAMIQLLDMKRLKKELEDRGLDNTGSKIVLADRLSDAVNLTIDFGAVVKKEPALVKKEPASKRAKKNTANVKLEEPDEPTPLLPESTDIIGNDVSTSAVPSSSKKSPKKTAVKKEQNNPVGLLVPKMEVQEESADESVAIVAVKEKKKAVRRSGGTESEVPVKRLKAAKREEPEIIEDDDDTPLLSILPPKLGAVFTQQISREDYDVKPAVISATRVATDSMDIQESSSLNHKHGTRSKARPSLDVSKIPTARVDQGARLLSRDDFAAEHSPPPPRRPSVDSSNLTKGDTDWQPALDEINKAKPISVKNKRPSMGERERQSTSGVRRPSFSEKDKLKSHGQQQTRGPTIAEKWAQKRAEMIAPTAIPIGHKLTGLSIKTESLEIGEKGVRSPRVIDERKAGVRVPVSTNSKVLPSPSLSVPTSSDDLLGSIMVDQSQMLGDRKRKQEEEERERELLAEKRKAAAMLSSGRSSHVRPIKNVVTVPPPPPAKRPMTLAPPPPPPKRKTMSQVDHPSTGTPPGTRSAAPILPPPPPPPPKLMSAAEIKKEPRSSVTLLPPPPPPKGPLPLRIKQERERRSSSGSQPGSMQSSTNVSKEASASCTPNTEQATGSNNLVQNVAKALLTVLQQRTGLLSPTACNTSEPTFEKEDTDIRHCMDWLISSVESVAASPSHSKHTISSDDHVNGEKEEYDPFATANIDFFEDYVPSAVQTRDQTLEEGQIDVDYESDDADADDYDAGGEEDDEDESESVQDDSNVIEKTARAAAGGYPIHKGETELMRNPRDLLLRASAVLELWDTPKTNETTALAEVDVGPLYSQMPLAEDFEYEPDDADKPAPDYHGEPVPSDDDMLFEIAAGTARKKKKEVVVEEEKLPSDETIEPDYYNADLHIKGAADKNWLIEPENADGLALMWGGVRSNYGIKLPFRDVRNIDSDTEEGNNQADKTPTSVAGSGKVFFQVKIVQFLSTKHLPFEELDPHDVRVGFTLRSAPNVLGEFSNSYCITSLGKKASNNVFTDFGQPFHQNDVITACIDFSEHTISYWKNHDYLGVAFQDIKLPNNDAVYPHICTKNCSVAVNFGDFPGGLDEWIMKPEWRFQAALGRGDLERSPKPPDSKSNCTVLMMVGLPGVGKSTWVRQYLQEHPEEQWTVIQAEGVMSAMKVNGVSRRRAHLGRWDMVMGMVGKSLQRSILLAARRRRNYIIDMTNTSRDVRKRRLQLFEEFQRKCLVMIPSEEEMMDRQARQARIEGTAMMPPEAMLEMKAIISIPAPDQEPIDDVHFLEPPLHRLQDAIDIVNRYNEEARPWFQRKYRRRRAQNIGLGPDRDDRPRKYNPPLTVLPQLRVSITPMGDTNRSPNFNNYGYSNNANFTPMPSKHMPTFDSAVPPPMTPSGVVFDRSVPQLSPSKQRSMDSPIASTPPAVSAAHMSLPNFSVPPPFVDTAISPSAQKFTTAIVPVTHKTAVPVDVTNRAPSPTDDRIQLDDEEMRQIRETTRTSSSTPIANEAAMLSKLRATQIKKKEKLNSMQTSLGGSTCMNAPVQEILKPVISTISKPMSFASEPRAIPTIGSGVAPITIDTSMTSRRNSHSPSLSAQNSPRNVTRPLSRGGVSNLVDMSMPPPAPSGFPMASPSGMQFPVDMSPVALPNQAFGGFTMPPPMFNMPPPMLNMPPPDIYGHNVMPLGEGYPPAGVPWNQRKNSG